MLKNKVSVICNNDCFEAVIILEQVADFQKCYLCPDDYPGDGRWTYLAEIKKLTDISTKKEIGIRTRLGIAIKKALLKKFHGRYLCEDCATKKWEIIIHK
jgi:hypothetical protein